MACKIHPFTDRCSHQTILNTSIEFGDCPAAFEQTRGWFTSTYIHIYSEDFPATFEQTPGYVGFNQFSKSQAIFGPASSPALPLERAKDTSRVSPTGVCLGNLVEPATFAPHFWDHLEKLGRIFTHQKCDSQTLPEDFPNPKHHSSDIALRSLHFHTFSRSMKCGQICRMDWK